MTFNLQDIDRVLKRIHPSLFITNPARNYVYDITKRVGSRIFPGELEEHAIFEEHKYKLSNPGEIRDRIPHIRQEYLVANILEMTGNRVKDRRERIITSREISETIHGEEKLDVLLDHSIEDIDSKIDITISFLNDLRNLKKDTDVDKNMRLSSLVDNFIITLQ